MVMLLRQMLGVWSQHAHANATVVNLWHTSESFILMQRDTIWFWECRAFGNDSRFLVVEERKELCS